MTSSRLGKPWSRVLLALLLVHVVWGVTRIPGKVYAQRRDEIAHYRAVGAARFHLDNEHRRGAEVVEFLRAHTDESSVVLWRGDWHGALEFVPPLIAPRLLVEESAAPPGAAALFGRSLARGRVPSGAEGTLVVVGLVDDLELVVR